MGAALAVWGGPARAELLVTETTVDGVAMNAPSGWRHVRRAGRQEDPVSENAGEHHPRNRRPYRGTLADYQTGLQLVGVADRQMRR